MCLQPDMQGIGGRSRLLLPNDLALRGIEVLDFPLNGIEPAEELDRLPGNLALVTDPQLMEFASRMGHAHGFADPQLEERLVMNVRHIDARDIRCNGATLKCHFRDSNGVQEWGIFRVFATAFFTVVWRILGAGLA